MKFTTRVALVLRRDLAPWQSLNVAAFLTSGVAATHPVVGLPYRDGDGVEYLPMIGQPIVIYEASAEELSRAFDRARTRDLAVSIFTEDLFGTGHDEANRAAVAGVATDELRLVGVGIYGSRSLVDKSVRGLSLHA